MLLLASMLCLSLASPPPPPSRTTRWPLYPQKPLLLAWNAPTEACEPRHRVRFPFYQFPVVAYPTEGFVRQNLTIFYKERLGLYPYYEPDGAPRNGGLPQLASLAQHLAKVPEGLDRYIKEPAAAGLAVLDWEEWRPTWVRNWHAKQVYRNESRRLTAALNPGWAEGRVARVAEQEFELAARRFMRETLRLVKSLRPNQLWGFYLFPDCYNHDYAAGGGGGANGGGAAGYTGRCPPVETARNDRLEWLWTESTALFPSVYLSRALRDRDSGTQFVRNRVREGMRLAAAGNRTARPVFVYARPTYVGELTLLTEMDLISTIGESVSLGAAGVILWGDSTYASSNASCTSLSEYLRAGALGRYLLNVTRAAEQCSARLCAWRGRCQRRDPEGDAYLHLSPRTHTIELRDGRLAARGAPDRDDLDRLARDFRCQCYTGYSGEGCALGGGVASRAPAGVALLTVLVVLHALH